MLRMQTAKPQRTKNELLTEFARLLVRERHSVAAMIVLLAEIEHRDIHLELGFSSMFVLCTRKFQMSENEAFSRLTAARLVRRHPQIRSALEAGKVSLSALVLMRNLITESNVDQLLSLSEKKSKVEVQALVAEWDPKPPVDDKLRERSGPTKGLPSLPSARAAGSVSPRAPDQFVLETMISAMTHAKIEKVRSLLRHRNPSGSLSYLVDAAFTALLEQVEKQRFGKDAESRPSKPSKDPGRISKGTKRAVYARDGGRCTFVGETGERCGARDFLEFDHVEARALGGTGGAANVRLRCRAHNNFEAKRVFGRAHVEKKVAEAQSARLAKAPPRKQIGSSARASKMHLTKRKSDTAPEKASQIASPRPPRLKKARPPAVGTNAVAQRAGAKGPRGGEARLVQNKSKSPKPRPAQ